MLNDLESSALTDPPISYAALIHVILDKLLELRGRLAPERQERMPIFTRDPNNLNILRSQRFLANLGHNHRAAEAMNTIKQTGADATTYRRDLRRQEAKLILTYLVKECNALFSGVVFPHEEKKT
jgi:hypothetical protein